MFAPSRTPRSTCLLLALVLAAPLSVIGGDASQRPASIPSTRPPTNVLARSAMHDIFGGDVSTSSSDSSAQSLHHQGDGAFHEVSSTDALRTNAAAGANLPRQRSPRTRRTFRNLFGSDSPPGSPLASSLGGGGGLLHPPTTQEKIHQSPVVGREMSRMPQVKRRTTRYRRIDSVVRRLSTGTSGDIGPASGPRLPLPPTNPAGAQADGFRPAIPGAVIPRAPRSARVADVAKDRGKRPRAQPDVSIPVFKGASASNPVFKGASTSTPVLGLSRGVWSHLAPGSKERAYRLAAHHDRFSAPDAPRPTLEEAADYWDERTALTSALKSQHTRLFSTPLRSSGPAGRRRGSAGPAPKIVQAPQLLHDARFLLERERQRAAIREASMGHVQQHQLPQRPQQRQLPEQQQQEDSHHPSPPPFDIHHDTWKGFSKNSKEDLRWIESQHQEFAHPDAPWPEQERLDQYRHVRTRVLDALKHRRRYLMSSVPGFDQAERRAKAYELIPELPTPPPALHIARRVQKSARMSRSRLGAPPA